MIIEDKVWVLRVGDVKIFSRSSNESLVQLIAAAGFDPDNHHHDRIIFGSLPIDVFECFHQI